MKLIRFIIMCNSVIINCLHVSPFFYSPQPEPSSNYVLIRLIIFFTLLTTFNIFDIFFFWIFADQKSKRKEKQRKVDGLRPKGGRQHCKYSWKYNTRLHRDTEIQRHRNLSK